MEAFWLLKECFKCIKRKRKINKYKNPVEKLPAETIVTPIAIAIPIIPNKFPRLEVSGDERPLRAKINNTPEIK